jgi:hypothetical protein
MTQHEQPELRPDPPSNLDTETPVDPEVVAATRADIEYDRKKDDEAAECETKQDRRMKMKWTQEETPKVAPFRVKHEAISLSVGAEDGRKWQHLMLTVGVHSEATAEECKETWPREAIAEARRRLDEFEAVIKEAAK